MRLLYTFTLLIYKYLLQAAAVFNPKAKLFVEGRKDIFSKLRQSILPNSHPIWFHFASLGEFEQGRPVLEKLKILRPQAKILITFFSPSGYEIRKNYPLADYIFYLPLDTPSNARQFIQIVNPSLAIFTKYEFWPNYFEQIADKKIPLYLISSIFRPNQIFFKWYGGFYRNVLGCISHFFVQNEQSLHLLNRIQLKNVSISGDTRFDRVYENALNPKEIPLISQFCDDTPTLIAGSTWLEDEKIIAEIKSNFPNWKIIIAPHEIHETHINSILKLFPSAIRFSEIGSLGNYESTILVIDNIGMLSSLYHYGKVAYIGGGFGAGIHNTLEAAAFGLPVIFGPNYQKFQEAIDLLEIGAAKCINQASELQQAWQKLSLGEPGQLAKNYVTTNKGATDCILENILKAS